MQNKGISKTSDHIKIEIKMPNASQDHSVYSKSPKYNIKDMDDLCTFKTRIESHNSGKKKKQKRKKVIISKFYKKSMCNKLNTRYRAALQEDTKISTGVRSESPSSTARQSMATIGSLD